MQRTMLSTKIHRATVTHADLNYVGSVTVDADLLDAADLLPGEQVAIVDVTNGARLETYLIEGERGSGVIGINGAAAHLIHVGDIVILIAYQSMTDAEARTFSPRIVHVDADNRIIATGTDPVESHRSGTHSPPHSVAGETAPDRVVANLLLSAAVDVKSASMRRSDSTALRSRGGSAARLQDR